MKIELKNLNLYPLNSEELSLWINDISSLEKQLNCEYSAYSINGILKQYINSQFIKGLSESTDHWIWYTYWFIIRKSDNKIIGTLSFNGKPNTESEVKISYALGEKFEHKGYMTEALSGLCKWIKQNTKANNIIAETKLDNYRSHRLLKRCKFKEYKHTDFSIIFRL